MTTRKLGFSALATAVYSRLTTHVLTSAYGFFAYVPTGTDEPYHVIKNLAGVESAEFNTRDTEAEENSFEIHSFFDRTSGLGPKACTEAQNNIIQALTSSDLSITGYHTPPIIRLDLAQVMRDDSIPTDIIWHGILRFRIIMAPSS